jgi:hypothetical protein
MGTSGRASRIREASVVPASGSSSPSLGNSTSLTTPSTSSRKREKYSHASSYVLASRIFGRARIRSSFCDRLSPSEMTCWECFITSV